MTDTGLQWAGRNRRNRWKTVGRQRRTKIRHLFSHGRGHRFNPCRAHIKFDSVLSYESTHYGHCEIYYDRPFTHEEAALAKYKEDEIAARVLAHKREQYERLKKEFEG